MGAKDNIKERLNQANTDPSRLPSHDREVLERIRKDIAEHPLTWEETRSQSERLKRQVEAMQRQKLAKSLNDELAGGR